jgi:hypothetical protein
VLHVGPATAHRLLSDPAESRPIRLISQRLDRDDGLYGAVLLCFGEIDCRVHIVRAALRCGVPIDVAVAETVIRYMEFLDWLLARWKVPVVLWGPPPSSPPSRITMNVNFPLVGTILDRNYATWCFNEQLRAEAARRNGVEFATVFDDCIDVAGVTHAEALFDGCHLDVQVMRKALPAVRAALRQLGLEELYTNFERNWQITPNPRLMNVAAGLVPDLNSIAVDARREVLTATATGRPSVATRASPMPIATIDMRAGFLVREVSVFALAGQPAEDARSLSIELSLDRQNWLSLLALPPESWQPLPSGRPLTVASPEPDRPFRFVRLALREPRALQLDTIQVTAPTFATTLIV